MKKDIHFLWGSFTLREALLLGFCATFIVLTRAALRIHFSLPGHSMFFLLFFLLMARGCVPKIGASTLVGIIAGLVCMLLGMTKMGPLILANFILPAIIVDIAGIIYPRMPASYLACLVVGVLASASKAISGIGLDLLLGMETEIIMQHVLITAAGSTLFGSAGSLLVPAVVRRLQANKLIPST
jgi:hypothetical protein